jgi:exodeoxyribonuclease VII large subunit
MEQSTEAAAPGNLVEYSVSELALALKRTVEDAFGLVRLRGEISGFKGQHTSGHCYFTLKDDRAAIEAVIWRSTYQRLKFKPEAGLEVVVRGRVTTFPDRSKYQIVIDTLEPAGAGALMALLEQRKKMLAAEGLFLEARKKKLPFLPRIIGVVTSPTGAVIRDILHRLADRFPCHVLVWPVRVQGETCAGEVSAAILGFNACDGGLIPRPDLIIVARGGGSLEDLWAFNEESVARAIAECRVPVISAVGHETDVTIADFVADVRAPTPSAAAELVVSRKDEFCGRIDGLRDRLHAAARGRIQGLSRRVHIVSSRPAFAGVPGRVAMRGRHADELTHALARIMRASIGSRDRRVRHLERQLATFNAERRLARLRTRLVAVDGQLRSVAARRQDHALAQLRGIAGRLESLSPLAVLARGYAVVWSADKTVVIRDAAAVGPGDGVRVTLGRGELDCEVRSTHRPDAADQPDKAGI